MCIRSSLVFALVVALAGALGCKEDRTVAHTVGGIDFVVRTSESSQMLGELTLRRDIDSKTLRLPVRAEGYQRRRVSLEPGLYTLDFEPDVGARVEDPTLPSAARTSVGKLPRWVVVAPAQVTTVNVATEVEASAPSVAALPDASLQLN